ncbi:MAG TPA: UbiA family prenyltransferase [Terracidiphilus sp.]|nr:UbiA family prenyltransferase [Terracidiphilus sp.]
MRLPQPVSQPESAATALPPLCVDLDGTLVKSDTLIDSLLVLVRTRPLRALALPLRVFEGRAAFKARVTSAVSLDVEHLPYNRRVLQFLEEEHGRGRTILLATGADERLARRIADHLGLFSGVLGSDGTTNLTGSRKLDGLRAELNSSPFDYIGNGRADLPLLESAAGCMVANPSRGLRAGLRARGLQPAREFEERAHLLESIVRAARPRRWAKNLLLFLPMLLAHMLAAGRIAAALLAFGAFSMAASAAYIVNDLLDLEADRRDRRKRQRPFAAGDLSPAAGLAMAALFLLLSLLGARLLPPEFLAWLGFYLVLTLAYSAALKRIGVVDALSVSALCVLRLPAGAAATQIQISRGMAGFSVVLFFSLAIALRFAKLQSQRGAGREPGDSRG